MEELWGNEVIKLGDVSQNKIVTSDHDFSSAVSLVVAVVASDIEVPSDFDFKESAEGLSASWNLVDSIDGKHGLPVEDSAGDYEGSLGLTWSTSSQSLIKILSGTRRFIVPVGPSLSVRAWIKRKPAGNFVIKDLTAQIFWRGIG